MAYQITVIGLDQTGVSIGLALAGHTDRVYRCGHDPAPGRSVKIKTDGAFDKLFYRLNEAVHEADCVLLCLPADQVEVVYKEMSDDLKPGCVVIDSGRHCTQSDAWAKTYLPDTVGFISMVPALNGAYLQENAEQRLTAHADLFEKGEMVIATSSETHPDAVKVATELTSMLGAHPFFTDLTEADGLLAKADLLPRLASMALLISTVNQPGWQDVRRIASKRYSAVAEPMRLNSEKEHPSAGFLANAQNTLNSLDAFIMAVDQLKEMIRAGDRQGLDSLLLGLAEEHTDWLDQRISGDWEKKDRDATPKPESLMRRLFGDPSKLVKK